MKNKMPLRSSLRVGFILVLAVSRPVFAEIPGNPSPADLAARFDKLESKILELQNQLAEQNKRNQEEIQEIKRSVEIKGPHEEKAVYLPPTSQKSPQWLEGLEMGGDFRLRYEALDRSETSRDQNRFRYRLRWKTEKHVTKDLDLVFRLVSGSSTDPTATNQTFTGDFTYKNIFVDQAYAKYRPSFLSEHIPHLAKTEIAGGKVANPFLAASSSMVWDPDVTPEGIYESLQFDFLKGKIAPFVTAGQFIVQENAVLSDAELYGFQGGLAWTPPGFSEKSGVKVTNAVTYYDYSDYARDSNFTVGGVSLARGNTAAGTSLAAGDFNILQLYNEIKFNAAKISVKLFNDFAYNTGGHASDPDNQNQAYEGGIRLGEAKKKGDWEALYYYAYIEPNAVVGAFSESDFGAGFADKQGNAVQLKYKLTDSLRLGLAASFTNSVKAADERTGRFQSDLEWIF